MSMVSKMKRSGGKAGGRGASKIKSLSKAAASKVGGGKVRTLFGGRLLAGKR